jgi:hypothetical protein
MMIYRGMDEKLHAFLTPVGDGEEYLESGFDSRQKAGNYSFLHSVQTSYGAYLAPYPMGGYRGLFPRG